MTSAWKKTLAFLGLVEDYDDEYGGYQEEAGARPAAAGTGARAEPSNVRRIDSSRPPEAPASAGERPGNGAVQAVSSAKVHLTSPTTFNDVEEVGDRFRNGIPVIMNLAGASEAVAKRLLDFASGLIFGLEGRIERVGDRVFLLTPMGVDVSSEERRRLGERGFFNQA